MGASAPPTRRAKQVPRSTGPRTSRQPGWPQRIRELESGQRRARASNASRPGRSRSSPRRMPASMNAPARSRLQPGQGLEGRHWAWRSAPAAKTYTRAVPKKTMRRRSRATPKPATSPRFRRPTNARGKSKTVHAAIPTSKGIAGARRVTVSPDGKNLYVAGQNDHTVVELARVVPPSPVSPPVHEAGSATFVSSPPLVTPIIFNVPPPVLGTHRQRGARVWESARAATGYEQICAVVLFAADSLRVGHRSDERNGQRHNSRARRQDSDRRVLQWRVHPQAGRQRCRRRRTDRR